MNASDKENAERPAILIADDEEGIRVFLRTALEGFGHPILTAANGEEAIALAKQHPIAVAVLDIKMPKMDGLSAVTTLRAYQPNVVCLIMTAFPAEQLTTNLLRTDIYNCLTKPVDLEVLRAAVRNALALASTPRPKEPAVASLSPVLLGIGEAIIQVRQHLERATQDAGPLLLVGEAGSRWGSVARAVHEAGPRRGFPFIEEILEEQPAHASVETASKKWTKLFDEAQGGTVFLNHLERLPLVAQWGIVQQLDRAADGAVRFIAAREERADSTPVLPELQQRVGRVVTLPPLRRRKEDIPQLVEEAMRRCNRIFNKHVQYITVTAFESLMNYDWPRNVEELEECLQQGVLLTQGETLSSESLPDVVRLSERELTLSVEQPRESLGLAEAVEQATQQVEQQLIRRALEASRWNRTQAAQQLGISRKSLHNKMKKYDIQGPGGHESLEDAE